MKKLSLSALLAAGVLAGGMTSANAADLGGNCCADLEERIAELEATTARKGNRKVSLTISGWVVQQITFWDDGRETNAYVSDAGDTLASHVKFTGSAQITSDWSAGYVLHIEAISNEPLAYTADVATVRGSGNPGGVGVYQSFWFLKSAQLGKLSIGLQSGAVDNQAILPDASGSLIPANYVLFEGANFAVIRSSDPTKTRSTAGTVWGSFASCATGQNVGAAADCELVPTNNVRYDTPTLGGFSGSASWGEDDEWGLSARYAGEFSSFKVSGAFGYFNTNSNRINGNGVPHDFFNNSFRRQNDSIQFGGYIQHVPTGLFFYGAYGKEFNDGLVSAAEIAAQGGANKQDGDNFYLKAGIRQKWSSLGHTVLFGEYGENHDKDTIALYNGGVSSTQLSQWGLGVVQEIDAAAISTWFLYRNYSADQTCRATAGNSDCVAQFGVGGLGGKVSFRDIDTFKVGGLINF